MEVKMPVTKQIPRDQLQEYFDTFSQRLLHATSPEAADIELMSTEVGDQLLAEGARLAGITYDPRTDSLEFSFELTVHETGDHRILSPREVWVLENDDGSIRSLEVVRPDGGREVVTLQRVGLRRRRA